MTQQLVLKPLGIISQPNKLGTIPQGALQFADQCYMRQPGMIENANTYNTVSPSLGTLGSNPAFVTQVDNQFVLATFSASGVLKSAFVDTNAVSVVGQQNFSDESLLSQSIDSTGRFSTTVVRNRVLMNAVNGTYVRELSNHGSMRSAGLPQPSFFGGQATGVGSALADKTHCAYTAIFVRRYADGYELISVPSPAWEVINNQGSSQNVTFAVNFANQANQGYIVAGDIIQVYRTKSQTWDPAGGTFTNFGSDFLLVTEYILKSVDITNGGVNFTDSIPDAALGEALYTNSGVKTQDGMAFPSPTAKVICTFKGYTFYFNRKDAPKADIRSPVWWGAMSDSVAGVDASTRKNGIGQRIAKGTTTSGSPTLTAVSAADLVGIVIGQQTDGGTTQFPTGSKVTSIGASSITFDHNATVTGTSQSIQIDDVLEVNGNAFQCFASWGIDSATAFLGANSAVIFLNLIIPQRGGASFQPIAVPAQPVALTFLRLNDQISSFTLRATNGANYVPQLPRLELAETAQTFIAKNVPNGITWSEQNQPENCPPLNTAFVGSGEIYAAYATRDAIWIFASDGLWRLSGTGGSAGPEGFDWRIDPVDTTLIIAGPQAGCVLRDMVYAYTNRGLVQIHSNGQIKELTLGRVDDRLPGQPFATPAYTATNAIFLIADETNDEIWMKESVTPGNRVWIYNYINDALTNDFIGNTDLVGNAPIHGCYSRFKQAVVFLDPTAAILTTPNNSTTRKKIDPKFQPLLGDNPFDLRMWQQCDGSFYVPDHNYGAQSISLYANGDTTAPFTNARGFFCGQRTLIATTTAQQTDGKFGRISWAIPRNAPAISYTFAPELYGGGPSVLYFQGLAVKFVDLTEQRPDR